MNTYYKRTVVKIPDFHSMGFMIKYTETDGDSHIYGKELHIHNEFELYINLSGDVSFLVENQLYPLTRGDVIFVRPGEYHHCVYRSNAKHSLFWILFDASNNQELLNFLKEFKSNYIHLTEDLKDEIIRLCYNMMEEYISDFEKLYMFTRIVTMLKYSNGFSSSSQNNLPSDFRCMLEYINKHIDEKLEIINVAKSLNFSVSTIERRFKECLGMQPAEYIKKKKMILALELLNKGETVLEAGMGVGYSDNSYFIKLFKDYFGVTPNQYKKQKTNGV